jgi:hypothetical protein
MASENYTLESYLNSSWQVRSSFFIPENIAGPDIIFFVQFKDGTTIPVIVQVKLRTHVHEEKSALATTDPAMLYGNSKVDQTRKENTISKMLDHCKNGVLRLLVAYPHESDIGPCVKFKNNVRHVIGVIDAGNAGKLFDKDHVAYLDALKNHKRKYDELEEVHRNNIKEFFQRDLTSHGDERVYGMIQEENFIFMTYKEVQRLCLRVHVHPANAKVYSFFTILNKVLIWY